MNDKNQNPRRALGKGLHSLLPPRSAENARSEAYQPEPPKSEPGWKAAVSDLDIDQIQPNPYQPRRTFDEAKLEELARSIRADGVIQPLVVRRAGAEFQLVAGERRWRAARLAGLRRVPVAVQDIPDEKLLEIALVENIQREDLNPLEMAQAFERMSRELRLNHEQIGERTGKDRATITNSIRLLQLPEPVQRMVAERRLSPGHARAILRILDPHRQKDLAERAVHFGWPVRKLEAIVAPQDQFGPKPRARKNAEPDSRPDPNVRAAIEELERSLATRVRIVEKRGGKGHIEIEYYSPEDLDRIYERIARAP